MSNITYQLHSCKVNLFMSFAIKEQIDELMQQYADEEIDGTTYAQKMMELTTSVQNEINEE